MAFFEHGEFCIRRSGLDPTFVFVRLFPASKSDDVVIIENFKLQG
jgi:hypothetical protein